MPPGGQIQNAAVITQTIRKHGQSQIWVSGTMAVFNKTETCLWLWKWRNMTNVSHLQNWINNLKTMKGSSLNVLHDDGGKLMANQHNTTSGTQNDIIKPQNTPGEQKWDKRPESLWQTAASTGTAEMNESQWVKLSMHVNYITTWKDWCI